ncbi:MAG: DNA-binding protein [Lachnospiraceae bacterium]|nr:DNA-binding protein [Lachnospiraceae bacterium]
MERIVEEGLLYDFYGPLLTGHQQKVYEMAVYDDLSLNEIAEMEGVSKQAVHDLLKRTTSLLRGYEDKLRLIAKSEKIRKIAKTIEESSTEKAVKQLAAEIVKESL